MPDTNLSKVIETTLENIKNITDVNTIIGEPMKVAGNTTIIPVSKISMGFTSGGIDLNNKANPDKAPNFAGGTGSGFSISPIAFLVVDEIGNVSLINVENPMGNQKDLIGTVTQIIEKAPPVIDKLMKIFKKDKKSEEPEKTGQEETENK